jgi:hypothetical protein
VNLHPEVQQFHDALEELEQFLRSQGEQAWADNVATAKIEVGNSDAHGLARFLQFSGRMGSPNDVVAIKSAWMRLLAGRSN